MSPGRWVARVGDLNSGILPLGLAKKATVDLHRRKDKGEPLNWITELNRHMIAEIDRLSVMVSLTDDERYHVKLRWGAFRAEFPHSEYPRGCGPHPLGLGLSRHVLHALARCSVATYVKANKRPGTQQATAAPREHHGPTRHGHTRRRSLPRCFLARFRRRAGGTRLSEAAGRPQLNRGPFSFSEMGLAFP